MLVDEADKRGQELEARCETTTVWIDGLMQFIIIWSHPTLLLSPLVTSCSLFSLSAIVAI